MFSVITNIIMVPGTQYGPVPFTLSDTQYPVASLILSNNSDNSLVLPNDAIQITGSNGSYNLTLTTAFNFRGAARVTLTATDPDDEVVSNVFTVYSDTAPTISAIGDHQTPENQTLGPIGFTIGDQELVAGSLTVWAQSSNPALVPAANISFGGGGASRTIAIQPAANLTGSSQISVIVSDGILTATNTFTLTVAAVVPPRLTGLQLLSPGVLRFTFTNTPAASFDVLSATNLSLPLSNWMVVGSATNIGSGLFQFTSPPTNASQLFYIIRSP